MRYQDKRGSNRDRANRKLRLLEIHGNGLYCQCVHCGCTLDFELLECDRIIPGGSYRLGNVQPSCAPCNRARGNNPDWVHPSRLVAA